MELADLLQKHGLEHELAFLEPFAHFEITLVPAPEHEPSLGGTRIGGGADAPADFAWPCQRWPLSTVATWPEYALKEVALAREKKHAWDEDGHLVMPISFLMQIDLEQIHPLDHEGRLPDRGLLLFFGSSGTDIEDPVFGKRVASAVRWVDAPRGSLVNHPQPPTPDPFPTSAVSLRPERSLSLGLSYEELVELDARLTTEAQKAFVASTMKEDIDTLFPMPSEEINGPMPPPGEIALACVVDHADVDLHIGDSSWMTFAMPIEDLAARRFESARASVYIG